jgi:hypothetical protein
MVMNVRAWRVAERVPALLARDATWDVAARFGHGLMLVCGTEALFIGDEETSAGPFNIQLERTQYRRLVEACADPHGRAHSDGRGTLCFSGMTLAVATAPRYVTTVPVLETSARLRLADCLAAWFECSGAVTGLGLSLQGLAAELSAHSDILGYLLGRGCGTTPSGDDVLVGLMAAGGDSLRAELARRARAAQTTGLVSRAFLRCAALGHFSEDLCLLLRAAQAGDERWMLRLIARISRFGHSSGIDLLAGLWIGCAGVLFGANGCASGHREALEPVGCASAKHRKTRVTRSRS